MNYFLLAVRDNFANFNGRSTRQEYWMFVLFNIIFYLTAIGLDLFIYLGISLDTLYSVAVFIPGLSAAVRRLHDVNKSGWFLLLTLIPLIGFIWLIVLMAKAGDPGKNQYGSSSDQSSLSDSKPEQIIKKIKSNKSGLQFNVNIEGKKISYNEVIEEKEEKTSAKDMYTKMQENANKKHYLAARCILAVLVVIIPMAIDDASHGYGALRDEIISVMWIGYLIFVLGGLIYLIYLSKMARRTQITYYMDKGAEQRLKDIKESFSGLNNAEEIFPSAGAYSIQYLDTNVETYGWKDLTDNDEIFFMPDVCLVNVKASGFIPIGYNKMYAGYTDSPDTAISPPSDSEILGKTWMHARKDGQPDQRYSNNPRVYSINKGFTVVSDSPNFDDEAKDSNFSAGLIISSPTIAKEFRSNMEKIFKTKSLVGQKKKIKTKSNLTQAEAISLIATYMGMVDGEFSKDEIMNLIQLNPVFMKYQKQVDQDKLSAKIKSGEATKEAAISTLKSKSKKVQLDALAIAWHVLCADGDMSEEEKKLMVELAIEFDFESLDPIQKRLEEMIS